MMFFIASEHSLERNRKIWLYYYMYLVTMTFNGKRTS